jgi:hypothetical protein
MSDARSVHDTAVPHNPMLESYLSRQGNSLIVPDEKELLNESFLEDNCLETTIQRSELPDPADRLRTPRRWRSVQ